MAGMIGESASHIVDEYLFESLADFEACSLDRPEDPALGGLPDSCLVLVNCDPSRPFQSAISNLQLALEGTAPMALEMRDHCEQCQAALTHEDLAFICSYECTFCVGCSIGMAQRCPNCSGELVRRPRRSASA